MINNIINAMTNYMYINLKNYNEFIVTNSINLYDKLIPQIKKQFIVMQKKSPSIKKEIYVYRGMDRHNQTPCLPLSSIL